jgi:hypothetical protein
MGRIHGGTKLSRNYIHSRWAAVRDDLSQTKCTPVNNRKQPYDSMTYDTMNVLLKLLVQFISSQLSSPAL